MSWTRRDLLRTGATTAATALLAPAGILRPSAAQAAGAEPVLVVLFLRGGADWLGLVPPYGDRGYYSRRPTLAVPRGSVLDLNGYFGLHPDLGPLLKHYRAGRLAVVHAFGSPDDTRSHFEAQDFLESAAPGNPKITTGWLGRYAAGAGLAAPWAALTLGPRPVRALTGASASLSLSSIEEFAIQDPSSLRRPAIERIAAASGGAWAKAARNALTALDEIDAIGLRPRVSWPSGELAAHLRDLSILIRSRIGVRAAALDMGGWDHHFEERDQILQSAATLARALDAFVADLGGEIERTVVLVVSEFGRSAGENGSGGTEHGRGGALLALGAGVRGGRVLLRDGRWPGLGTSQLLQGRDLAVTTDFRDAFAEVLYRHMKVTAAKLAPIFPGFAISGSRFPGLFG
jgi:uncharacterized protein (DUF1501 family)